MSDKILSRLGECPNCKVTWDGGDILEALSAMDVHMHKSDSDIMKLASEYGWSKSEPKNLSLANVIEYTPVPLVKTILLECPKCLHVFEEATSKNYKNLTTAKREILQDDDEQDGINFDDI